jgi:hypothetical protein
VHDLRIKQKAFQAAILKWEACRGPLENNRGGSDRTPKKQNAARDKAGGVWKTGLFA